MTFASAFPERPALQVGQRIPLSKDLALAPDQARLPGLGPRSARRAALHLIKKRELLMAPLAAALETAMEKIEICKVCGKGLYRNVTLFRGGWSRCTVCDEFVHHSCLVSGKFKFLKVRPRVCKMCRVERERLGTTETVKLAVST